MPFINPAQGAELNHLTPRPTQSLFGDNYLSFDSASGGGTFAQQFLPEIYEKEVERYGKRTISGFLKMVGAEMPLASDQVIWSEQGRLHIAYDSLESGANTVQVGTAADNTIVLPAGHLVQQFDTVIIVNNESARLGNTIKCRVSAITNTGATCLPYSTNDLADGSLFADGDDIKVFVYGNEYPKGSSGIVGSIDAGFTQFSNRPIILRDRYQVNGSDTAQIGWVEVTTENGASGYLWYLKSEHEARLRFEDYLEMSMLEAEEVESGSQISGVQGTQGLFDAINSRGLIYTNADFDSIGGSAPYSMTGLTEFDTILGELDKQGAIEENMLFLNRATALSIDNMLAQQNAAFGGGTSFGVFNNSQDMALNLGFSGFRRGSYDFYKSDFRYLNDLATRGGINAANSAGAIRGVIIPAGTSTVYDQMLGKNLKRPFLHVRYRASQTDDRRMKTWVTGSVGAATSALDAMQIHMLSERCLVTQGANNFMLMK